MEPAGSGRLVVSLAILTALALLVRSTMQPGKYQQVTWLLLGFFALRVVLGWSRSRRMSTERPLHRRDDTDV